MDDNQKACIGFSLCGGIGPVTFAKLISRFGTPHEAFYAHEKELLPHFFRENQYRTFLEYRSYYSFEKEIQKLEEQGVWVMTQFHDDYPKNIKEISDPPICIFGKGDRKRVDFAHETCIGIVGTRNPTAYGRHVAEMLGHAFTAQGLTIVSGMALGIDTISHRSAIEGNGKTIAVLGTSIDTIYPPENRTLHNFIIKEHGIVISEHPPGRLTSRGMFAVRNRIIVGLSRAIVVVEGGAHSGSLITARYAAENGRDVYAVPGPITSLMSVGPHILLGEGARLLTSADVVLEDLGFTKKNEIVSRQCVHLTEEEQKIYDLLSIKKRYADEVAKKISLSVSDTLSILSLLEVRGVIGKDMDGGFTVRV